MMSHLGKVQNRFIADGFYLKVINMVKIKGLSSRRGIGGYKAPRKSWDVSGLDKKKEDRKVLLVMIGVIVVLILMALLFWWIRSFK